MVKIAIFFIKIYQKISKTLEKKQSCKFYPTCSVYSIEVFKKYGFLKGLYKTLRRISKCHPFSECDIDLP